MADYGVISDVSTSLVTLLDQDLRETPLNARAQLYDLSKAAIRQTRYQPRSPHFANNGPVTPAPDHADSHLRRTR